MEQKKNREHSHGSVIPHSFQEVRDAWQVLKTLQEAFETWSTWIGTSVNHMLKVNITSRSMKTGSEQQQKIAPTGNVCETGAHLLPWELAEVFRSARSVSKTSQIPVRPTALGAGHCTACQAG